jgi:O-antigen ligase
MVGYWPGVLGAGTTLRWSLLWVGSAVLSCWGRLGSTNGPTKPVLCMLLFSVYMLVSLMWSPFKMDGLSELMNFTSILLSIIIGMKAARSLMRCAVLAAAFGIGLNSIFAVIQWYGFHPVIQLTPRPSGLFLNGNVLAEISALVLVGCWNTRSAWMSVLSSIIMLPALLLPQQRGSMIALAIAGMIWLIQRWRYGWSLASGIALILLAGACFMATGSVSSMWTWEQAIRLGSISERLSIWSATIDGFTLFGHGAGSFRGLFPLYAPQIDTMILWPQHAHNDLLELIFEYGIFAAIPAALASLCLMSNSPYRWVVLVFLVEGCSGFPLFMPATSFLAALCMGHCLRHVDWARFAQLRSRVVSFLRAAGARFSPNAMGGAPVPI